MGKCTVKIPLEAVINRVVAVTIRETAAVGLSMSCPWQLETFAVIDHDLVQPSLVVVPDEELLDLLKGSGVVKTGEVTLISS